MSRKVYYYSSLYNSLLKVASQKKEKFREQQNEEAEQDGSALFLCVDSNTKITTSTHTAFDRMTFVWSVTSTMCPRS